MTPREAFKIGYMARLVHEKRAAMGMGWVGPALATGLTAGPMVLGAGAGHYLARAGEADSADVDDAKNEEVRIMYEQLARRAEQSRAVKDFQAARQQAALGSRRNVRI